MGIYPEELKSGSWRDICPLMYIAALYKIGRTWMQPNVHGQMNGFLKSAYPGILFSHKKNLSYTTKWMNFKDIMLSEIRTQRTNIAWFH